MVVGFPLCEVLCFFIWDAMDGLPGLTLMLQQYRAPPVADTLFRNHEVCSGGDTYRALLFPGVVSTSSMNRLLAAGSVNLAFFFFFF